MLKVVSESDDESTHEAEALRFWCGDGAVRLVRHDAVRRALLLERAVPGQDASALHDAEALPIALRVGERLWRLTERARPYEAVTDRVPAWLGHAGAHELVAAARHIYERLAPRTGILVHGDLHHHNLLRHGGRWVAIDPKPILGEPEYDVVTLLWNPIGHVPTRSSVEGRIALLAEGGLDPERMRAWAIVRGVSLGLPLGPSETEDDPPQLRVARLLLESR